MTIHRDMYDKNNNKQDVKMENENEEQPGEETEESLPSTEAEEGETVVEAEESEAPQEEPEGQGDALEPVDPHGVGPSPSPQKGSEEPSDDEEGGHAEEMNGVEGDAPNLTDHGLARLGPRTLRHVADDRV